MTSASAHQFVAKGHNDCPMQANIHPQVRPLLRHNLAVNNRTIRSQYVRIPARRSWSEAGVFEALREAEDDPNLTRRAERSTPTVLSASAVNEKNEKSSHNAMSLLQPIRILHTESSPLLGGQEHRTLLEIVARCGSDLKGRHFGIPGLVFEVRIVLLKAVELIDSRTIYEPKGMRDKGFEYFPSGRRT